jgi:ABC-type nickel/cobalt efflux system permease component RcnA
MSNQQQSDRRRPRVIFPLLVLMLSHATAFAHPMGNFSVNHYSKLTIEPGSIEIEYLIDLAEIPTFQEIRQFDLTSTGVDPNASRYLDGREQLFKEGISLEIDGQPVRLSAISRRLTYAEGAGGLPTMKIGFLFRGQFDVTGSTHKLAYTDDNFPGRAGWKEVVVLGAGVAILESSAPATDRSQELANYSTDLLTSPPQQLSALVDFRTTVSTPDRNVPTAGTRTASNRTISTVRSKEEDRARTIQRQDRSSTPSDQRAEQTSRAVLPSPAVQNQNTPRSRFTELISTQCKLSFWVLLSAALIAAGLGALHALEPGHGKTMVAAYLVGSRGTARHAVLLGIVVTAAHTAGVFLLGLLTLYASRYIVPEQLYPWLGTISGLSVAGLGLFIFLRHWTGQTGEHSHQSGQQHSHWFSAVLKQASAQPASPTSPGSNTGERALSLPELCMLGITGGIVPCPAALVVLLSAFSLHRIGFGLFLITAFSTGLAIVLVTIGLTMVYAKRAMSSRLRAGSAALRYLPFLSAAFMVMLGIGITTSAVLSVPSWHGLLSTDKFVPFVTVILLGLFLGMRHSTDADHVVAVSTIVSRQASIRSSATIGLLWGLGHTLTIFLVGSAIIVFGVVIPPRLGLSMEFCVALMLVVLGILNLTGIKAWVTGRLTSRKDAPAALQPSRWVDCVSESRDGTSSGANGLLDRTVGRLGLYQAIRPFVVGLVHGLAGSAAVALLVLSTIKSPLWSTAYLVVFGLGTVAGMMLMTATISIPLVYAGRTFLRVNRYLIAISGVASMAFGIFLVYHIGFVDGLFTARVHWTPQ